MYNFIIVAYNNDTRKIVNHEMSNIDKYEAISEWRIMHGEDEVLINVIDCCL